MPAFPSVRSALQAPRPVQRALLFGAGLILLFLAVQLVPSAAPSGPLAGEEAVNATARPSRTGPRLLSPGNLIALALLGGGGLFALHLRRRAPGTAASDALQPLGQLALGQHGQLRLVRCGDEVLLLGVTAQQVNLLQRYPAARFAPAEGSASEASEPPLLSPAFAEFLRSAATRGGATRPAQPQKAHA